MTQVANRSKTKMHEMNGNTKTTSRETNGHVVNGSSAATKKSTCLRDQCAMSPDTVRYEAECLRTDFNLRMKQIIFNSVISAYYVAFIPLKFTQVRFFHPVEIYSDTFLLSVT